VNLKIIRELKSKEGKRELLIEVDDELMDIYRSETGETDFEQETFDEWINELIKHALEEDWGDIEE